MVEFVAVAPDEQICKCRKHTSLSLRELLEECDQYSWPREAVIVFLH